MSGNLTYGIKLTADGNLVGEVKSARTEIDNLKKSTDDLSSSAQRGTSQAALLNSEIKKMSATSKEYAEGVMGMSIAESNAKDKAWALANGYKDVENQLVKNTAALGENGGAHKVNSMAVRESMVMIREAMNGNFTRMAGSASILTNSLGLMPAVLSPIGLGVIGVAAAVGGGIYAWQKYGETLEDIHAKLDSVADVGLQNMQDKIYLQNQTLANKLKVNAQTGLTGVSDAEANKLGVLSLQIDVYTTRLNHAKQNTDEFAESTRGLAKAQDSYNKMVAQLADRQSLQQQNKDSIHPAKDKIDPNDTLVINMQTEAFKKEMEAMGASAAEIKVLQAVRNGANNDQAIALRISAEATDAAIAKMKAETDAGKSAAETEKQLADSQVEGERVKIAYEKEWQAILANTDPIAKATQEWEKLLKLQAALGKSDEEIGQAYASMFEKTDKAIKNTDKSAEQFAKNVQRNVGDVLYNGLQGKFSGIGDLFKQMLLRMEADAMSAQLAKAMFGQADGIAKTAQGTSGTTGTGTNSTATEAAGAAAAAGWIGLAVVAAASIIKSMGYDHGNKSATDIQSVQATGQVFGDMAAKSATIAQVSQAIKLNSDEGLIYSQGMLSALTQMNSGISSFVSMIVRTNPSLTTGANMGIQEGQIGQSHMGLFDIPVLNLFKGIVDGFSKTTQNITDSGLKVNGTASSLMGGNGVQAYADSNTTTSKYWGLQKSTDANATQYGDVGSGFATQIGKIFTNLHDVIVNASAVFGKDANSIDQIFKTLDISTGKISLKGLTGQALTDTVSQMITTMSDSMVGALKTGVLKYAQVGEDAITTLVRVANETESVSVALDRMGVAEKPAASAMMGIAESLIAAAGGADAYTSKMSFFTKNFLSAAQQLVPSQNAVNKAFADMNLAIPATRTEFTALMQSANLTTTSGRALHVALLDIAPAFNSVVTASEAAAATLAQQAIATAQASAQIATQRSNMEIQLMTAQGNAAGALAAQRRLELAAMVASSGQFDATATDLQPLQQQIYDAQDKASADQAAAVAASNAASAAMQLKSAWQSVTDSIFGEVARIRGLMGTQTASGAQSQFAIATAQARSGDMNAAKLLPAIAQALDTISSATATTALDLARSRGRTASSLATTGTMLASRQGLTIPAFAGGGDHAGGWRVVGDGGGPELEFTGPSHIVSNSDSKKLLDNSELVAEMKALRQAVAALERAANATAANTRKTSDLLVRVTRDGDSLVTVPA